MKLLLDRVPAADVMAPNTSGKSALDLGFACGEEGVAAVLLAHRSAAGLEGSEPEEGDAHTAGAAAPAAEQADAAAAAEASAAGAAPAGGHERGAAAGVGVGAPPS